MKVKSDTEVEVPAEIRDFKTLFGVSWDDFTDKSVRCVINRVQGYGAFVTALVGDSNEMIPGMSGLLHYSRASLNGQSLSAVELSKQLKVNEVVRIKLVGWSDQGPMLARSEK